MRVTPLEIRQKTFEKHFRGYDKDEVNAFLLTLSQEWERTLDENKELRIKLEGAEREVTKLREVESSLYKTLKTAEDTGANVIEQARAAADLHLKESQMKAEGIISEAKSKAKDTIEESEIRARQIVEDMEDRLKTLVENYKKLETSREDLISELKHLANDTLDRVERARVVDRTFDPDKHFNAVRREAKGMLFPNGEPVIPPPAPASAPLEAPATPPVNHKENVKRPEPVLVENVEQKEEPLERQPVLTEPQPQKVKVTKSFFDDIE